jgi:hypothetical protein
MIPKTDVNSGCLSVIFVLAIASAIFLLVSAVLQWAWNIVMPGLFDVRQITYVQAVAIYAVVNLIGGAFKVIMK